MLIQLITVTHYYYINKDTYDEKDNPYVNKEPYNEEDNAYVLKENIE